MSERPIKHVMIPPPPTEMELIQRDMLKANADAVKSLNDQLTAAQQRVAELERLCDWVASEAHISDGQAVRTKGNMKAMHSGYAKAMLKVAERIRKALDK